MKQKAANNQVNEKAIDKFFYQSGHTLSLAVEDPRPEDLLGRPIKKPHNPPELLTQLGGKEKGAPKNHLSANKNTN